MKSSRFTLEAPRWYAAEFIGDEFGRTADYRSYSPIRVDSLLPMKSGKRTFQLTFYHANYPEGVRDKIYSLETLERGAEYVLARSLEHDPARLMMIYSISWEWMSSHFGTQRPSLSEDLDRWLSLHV